MTNNNNNNNNIKKLCGYMADSIRECLKSSSFRNLNSCKDNRVIITNETEFLSDNKDVIEVQTLYKLNSATLDLLYAEKFLTGKFKNDVYYTPLIYCNCQIIREDDKLKLEIDNENKSINISALTNLISGNEEQIESVVEDIMSIDNIELNIEKVLEGLINLDGLKIEDKKGIVLARIPDASASMIKELRQIAEMY